MISTRHGMAARHGRRPFNFLASSAVALMTFSAGSGAALAQAAAADNDASALMEEIVVTGTKKARGQQLQTAPVSATVLGQRQILALRASDISDLGQVAPNVNLRMAPTIPGSATFFIRGSGVLGTVMSDDPTVAIVIDGMTLGVNNGAHLDTFDLEGVEILRGPQGALFGRNTTGGAVVLRSIRPTEEFKAKIRGNVGNYEAVELSGLVQGKIAEGVAAKVAVLYKSRDGYLKSLVNGGRQGDQRSFVVRPTVTFKPGGDFDFTVTGERAWLNGEGGNLRAVGYARPNPFGAPGKRETIQENNGKNDQDWWYLIGEGNLNIAGGVLTSITAYRDLKIYVLADVEGGPQIFTDTYRLNQHQFSQELRWNGKVTDYLELTTGVHYFDQTYGSRLSRAQGPLYGNINRGAVGFVDHKAVGIFGQAEVTVANDVAIILGGRYTNEKKKARIAPLGLGCPNAPSLTVEVNYAACTFPFRDKKSWSDFSPKVGLNWKASDDAFFFASWTKGFRSGGYNVRSTNPLASPGPYDPETVDAYEVGSKLDLFDDRLRFNTSFYYNKFSDLQRTVSDPAGQQTILNAANARIWGVEQEINWAVFEGFVLSGSVGYTNGKYKSFAGLVGAAVPIGDLLLSQVPKWTANVTGVYSTPIGEGVDLTLRSSYSYKSKVSLNDQNTVLDKAYGLVDMSASINLPDRGINIAAYAKNVFDIYYNVNGYPLITWQVRGPGAPRTFGLELTYSF